MPPQPQTGNPVFDFKARFRTAAQSAQRILIQSGVLLVLAGAAARFVTIQNPALKRTFALAPAMGLALVVLSAAWSALRWRNKLRRDFQRAYSVK